MTKSTLYIIFHGRFPSEKAAALFAKKSALSFAKHVPVVLLVPRRLKRGAPEPLPPGVRAVYLPVLDFFNIPILERIAFPLSFLTFSLACLVYLFVRLQPEDCVDTNESLPALAVSLLTRNIIFEVHDFPERFRMFYALLFKRVRMVLATNAWKKQELMQRFALTDAHVLLERNGVDLTQFAPQAKREARRTLNLSETSSIAVYTGHLYGWKGVETLAEAALLLPDVEFYVVGGNSQDVARFIERYPAKNIHAVGYRPHEEIPVWQAAADVLILPNTGEEEISAHYTSPMKLFEYMASERPIVASNVPSIAEVLDDTNAYLVAPDDPRALADMITRTLRAPDEAKQKGIAARMAVEHHSWERRAERMFAQIKGSVSSPEGFRFAVVIAAYTALLGALFFPFFFQGALFSGSDVTVYYYAAFDFYHKALVSGQSFLWNPLLFSGFPMYLSQVAGFFEPLNYVLFHFANGYAGVHIRLFIDFLLLLIASFGAVRAWGMSRLASFCVGLGFLLTFNETYISNLLVANALFIMPLLVWVLGRVREKGGFSLKWGLVAGVGVGFAMLGGNAQMVTLSLTLFGILGVLYALVVLATGKLRFLLRFIGFCMYLCAIGFVIALPQIVPALQFVPLTRRAAGVEYALASLKAIEPGDLLLFLFPDYTYFPYVTGGRKALYVGALWFLFAAGAVRMSLHRLRGASVKQKEILIFAGVFLLSLLIALDHSPLFYVLQHVPVFKLFRFSDRWMWGGSFFLAMLGGFGFDALAAASPQRYLRRWYAIVSAPVLGFLVLIIGLNISTNGILERLGSFLITIFSKTLYGHGPFTKDPTHYQEAAVRGLEAWKGFVSFTDLSFFLPTSILFLSLMLVWLWLTQRISLNRLRVGVLVMMVATCLCAVPFQFDQSITRARVNELQTNSFMQFIPESDRAMYRYYPFMVDASFRKIAPPTYRLDQKQIATLVEVMFATGWPNTNFAYDMASVDGYDVFIPQSYIDPLTTAGSTFGAQDNTRSLSEEEKIRRLEHTLSVIGVLGGKYIVSGVVLQAPELTLVGTYDVSDYDLPVYVYANATALPHAYFARAPLERPGKVLQALIDAHDVAFTTHTYLDCTACAVSGEGSVRAAHFENGNAQFDLDATKDAWFVFSESNLPGWSATIDGQETSITQANGMYMAVRVPKGAHHVAFVYRGVFLSHQ